MAKISDIDLNAISFLFKSSPGFGKTLAAASFAVAGPVYLSYWDKKSPVELSTFFTDRRFGSKAKKIKDNIEYDTYGSQSAHQFLNKLIKTYKEGCPYFAMINDSLTWMTASAVNWSLNFGKVDKTRAVKKDIKPDFDEYKVETSIVSQCIDICRELPCHVIWTAHPLSTISLSGSGSSMRVDRTNPIVSYGSKVASMIPGSFSEIYHFSQKNVWGENNKKQYLVNTEAVGDEFAKSPLLGDYIKEFDITDRLFYEVWKELLDKSMGIEPKPPREPITLESFTSKQPTEKQPTDWKV